MKPSLRERFNLSAFAAGVITLLTTAFYLSIIANQDEAIRDVRRVEVVTVVLVVASALAIGGTIRTARHARLSLGIAAVVLFVMGLVGIFSIGVFLLMAAALAAAGTRAVRPAVEAASARRATKRSAPM